MEDGTSSDKNGLDLISWCIHNYTKKNLSVPELQSYTLAWSISGIVMTVVISSVFITFVLAKAYQTPLQRLFLALTFFTVLDVANNSFNIMLYWPEKFNESFCRAIGYADVSIFITSQFLALSIGVFLLVMTYYNIQGRSLPKFSKFHSVVLEVGFLVLVIGVPPATLVPKADFFGVAGPFCWIKLFKATNSTKCEISDASDAFELHILSTYTAVMAVNIAIFFLLKVISCLLARRHNNVRLHHVHMAKKASILVICLSLTFVIEIATYWCHYKMLDSKTTLPLYVRIIIGIIVPISPAFIPLGFTVYLYSVKTVKLKTLKERSCKAWRSLVQRSGSKELKSPQSRSGVDTPSDYTVSRQVAYTGAFTSAAPSTYGSIDHTAYSE